MRHYTQLLLAFILFFTSINAFAQIPRTISFQGVLADAQGNLVTDGNHQLTLKLYDVAANGIALYTETQTVPVVKGIFNVIIGSNTPLPQSLTFDRAYFLGVSVDGGNELIPRTALTAVPYALRAERANIAESLSPNAAVVTHVNNQSGDISLVGAGTTTITNNGNQFTISSTGTGSGIGEVKNTDGTISIQNPTGPTATIGVANNSINAAKLSDGAVTSTKIASGQVVTSINNLKDAVTLNAGSNIYIAPSGNSLTISSTGGSGVPSVNSITGPVTIAATGGATVNTAGNTITINAGAGGGGTGIQGVQNTNNTIDILNPNGPTATINVKDQGITTTQLADNAVTVVKILPDIVSRVDGVANDGGNIDLVAGANITITPDDAANTITIAATASGGGGDITAVNAGTGLSGGGNSGDVTLSVAVPLSLSGSSTNSIIWCSNSGSGSGVQANSAGIGVQGNSGSNSGVYGGSISGYGVNGISINSVGVYGTSNGSGSGVSGTSNSGYGVEGFSVTSSGVRGKNGDSNNYGYLAGNNYGAYGFYNGSGNYGYLGSSNYGVYGLHNASGNYGYIGGITYGVYGKNLSMGPGVRGEGGSAEGVSGTSTNGSGVSGYSNSGDGVHGTSNGNLSYGVYGVHSTSGNYGYLGSSLYGVRGYKNGGGNYAGYFSGNVNITGSVSAASSNAGIKAFKIDHPLYPATKYLYHSSVESPDMKNIYDGVVTLDANGEAVVQLPEWFETLNKDFRYQLTCVGEFAPVFISEKISNNTFKISGGKSGLEVSWQVTGIRHDPFAEQHRIQVEELKTGKEAGKYLYPKEYGVSEMLGVDYEELMQMESERKQNKAREATHGERTEEKIINTK